MVLMVPKAFPCISPRILLSLLILLSHHKIDGLVSIYDLSNDPFEATSLFGDASLSNYQSMFEQRMSVVKKEVLNATSVQQSDSVNSIFKTYGGTVPWLSDMSNAEKPVVERTNQPSTNAPNIVFMLLDDVGINDMTYNDTNTGWLFGTTRNLLQFAREGITLTNHFTAWVSKSCFQIFTIYFCNCHIFFPLFLFLKYMAYHNINKYVYPSTYTPLRRYAARLVLPS
jgi:hypothetical protein